MRNKKDDEMKMEDETEDEEKSDKKWSETSLSNEG